MDADPGGTATTTTRLGARRLGLIVVIGCFAVSRVAYALAGMGFDASALHPTAVRDVQWQLLPLSLLRHHLLSSVWNLHSQPPLYNLACGLLLRLPSGARAGCAAAVFVALGVVMVSLTYLLLAELGVDLRLAAVVTIVVVADPAAAVYEHWLSWSYPTGAALTAGAYCLARFARTRSTRWAALSATAFAAVVLLDATFQWPWLVAATAALAVAGRAHWRRAIRAAALPVVLVAGWYIKDATQFATVATSSWLGMNLWQSTLAQAPAADVQRLVGERVLTPLAAREPFQSVSAYRPEVGATRRTGVPALDRPTSELGVPNFNNLAYIAVSDRYLSEDLAYIRARAARYGRAVTMSLELWSIPAEQYVWPERDSAALAGYARLFDRTVLLQPGFAGDAIVRAEFAAARPSIQQLSWTVVGVTAIDLLLTPVALVRRRRNRLWVAVGTLMWVTVAYSIVVTSLTELGENMRFRFELGTLPLVLAVATLAVLCRPAVPPGGRQHPHRADRQVRGGDQSRDNEQDAAGAGQRRNGAGQPHGQAGDAGGDRTVGGGRPGVVVQVGEHERPARPVPVDAPGAQRRPGDERHDLVGVADEGFQQPAAQGGDGAGDEGGAGVGVARHDQAGGQRQGRPDDQPGGRGGDEQ